MRTVLAATMILSGLAAGLSAQAQQQSTRQSVCQRQCLYGQCTYNCTDTVQPVAAPEEPKKPRSGTAETVNYDGLTTAQSPMSTATPIKDPVSSQLCPPPYVMTERDGCQPRRR